MAEVLTQSQIDALLNTVMENGSYSEAAATENIGEEKKYKKYDFYSPKKFTKDKLKIITSIYENYARIVSSRLNGLLRASCELEIVTVEEERYYEFSNALKDNDMLSLLEVRVNDNENTTHPAVLHINSMLMLSMMDKLIGSTVSDVDELDEEYKFTDIERALFNFIIKHIVDVMKSAWANYLDLDFLLTRTETNPTLVQTISKDDNIVIIVMRTEVNGISGTINLCLPASLLLVVFDIIEEKSGGKHNVVKNTSDPEEIFRGVKETTLELRAEVGGAIVLLSDIYNLQVGDVINLNKPKDTDIQLFIGEKAWFNGRLGVYNKQIAVKIESACEEEN